MRIEEERRKRELEGPKTQLRRRAVERALVVVEAIDDRAARFYRHFGFIPFPTTTDRLFIPMKSVKGLFG